MPQSESLSVFYDGLCPLCSREIDHYKKQRGHEHIKFVDITEVKFDASAEGLDPYAVHKVMHVKSSDGKIHTGVDAFVQIWKRLPKYQFMVKWAQNPLVKPFLNLGYQGFVIIRPLLPRRKRTECETSPYCETRRP